MVIFSDAEQHLITAEAMLWGILTQMSVHSQVVLRRELHHDASTMILMHNHQQPELSQADEVLAQTLHTALAMVNVRVVVKFTPRSVRFMTQIASTLRDTLYKSFFADIRVSSIDYKF